MIVRKLLQADWALNVIPGVKCWTFEVLHLGNCKGVSCMNNLCVMGRINVQEFAALLQSRLAQGVTKNVFKMKSMPCSFVLAPLIKLMRPTVVFPNSWIFFVQLSRPSSQTTWLKRPAG
eukprot:92972-Pelagomonas_calceolata.AAC.1